VTAAEFKAWFEGFAENIAYAPTGDQWERIKARVAELDDGRKPVKREATSGVTAYPPGRPKAWRVDPFGNVLVR
jgi:hypothetical protein